MRVNFTCITVFEMKYIGLSKYDGSVSTHKPNGGLNVLERGDSLTLHTAKKIGCFNH